MLVDTAEPQVLSLSDAIPPLAAPPAVAYLDWRYDEPAQYLLPGQVDADTSYSAVLDPSLVQRMARRFPAVLANARAFANFRVYVLPSGRVEIRHRREHDLRTKREVPQDRLVWLSETGSAYLASYILDGRPILDLRADAARDRTQDRQVVQHDGGLVDLDEQPAGVGSLEWFDNAIDAQRARNLGLDTPQDVIRARENGTLTNVPVNQRPWTVWWPEVCFLNPVTQPQGDGHWEYYTSESERLAWTNLGGQNAFPNSPRPTALEIYTRRLVVRALALADETAGIDIVWVPAVPTAPTQPPIRQPPRTSSSTPQIDTDVTDPDSEIDHQPENRGENDQTGVPGERKYQTIRMANGRTYTVDRSRAHADKVQEWKSYALNKKGAWFQWKSFSTIDWTTQESVEKMNKWREQALKRAGFPVKRKGKRLDYTAEERTWVFGFVRAANGGRPNITMAELIRRFNERFGEPHREELGVQSVCDRLRTEYKENGGQMKERPGRTGPRKESHTRPEPEPEPSDDEDDDDDEYDSQYDDDEE